MFVKLTTIATAAMLVSFTAYAQDSTAAGGEAGGNGSNSTSSEQDNHQMEWDAKVGETFYSDMKARTLRPEAEWSANWTKLTDDQRANIKKDCEAASQSNRDPAETQICTFASSN